MTQHIAAAKYCLYFKLSNHAKNFKITYLCIVYSAPLTKGSKAHGSIFVSLKILNLPPQIRDRKEVKPLLAVIDCQGNIVNKFNKTLTEYVNKKWRNQKIWDLSTLKYYKSNFYILAFINDLQANRQQNYLKRATATIACM